MKCENCGKYEARVRDYRTVDGCTGKVFHCRWCADLNDVTLYRIQRDELDPITFYDDIDFETLPIEELEELKDEELCNCMAVCPRDGFCGNCDMPLY